MAEHHALTEAEEQIDLDGDNDIEDMMDDEDALEDDGYRKARDEYVEDDSYRKAGDEYHDNGGYKEVRDEYREDDDCRKIQDEYADDDRYRNTKGEYMEEEHGSEGEGCKKVAPQVGPNYSFSPLKDNDNSVESKEGDNIQKFAELLSLPPHGSEVFIGGIPRAVADDDLKGLCEPFGEIFEIKLMEDKDTKENKGFAFVTFTTKDCAQKAIEEIHDKEFMGRTLRCSLSQVKNRLFIGNIPKGLTEEDLKKILEKNGPGVENIEYFKDPQNPSRNRGFLFVEYYNHACAEYARQKMSRADFSMDGTTPAVSWADPKNPADASAAAQVKAIYLKNLPETVTTEKLKELFEHHGEITKVVLPFAKVGGKRDFGFIHFADRSSALKAVKGTEKYEIDGQVVEVTIAKPQTEKKFDHASHSYRPGFHPSYPQYPTYGGGYGAAGYGQPMIYGRGPMPQGMQMVPIVLPDGRLGYVLQQPEAQASPPRRSNRGGGSSNSRGRDSDGSHGRRYHPY